MAPRWRSSAPARTRSTSRMVRSTWLTVEPHKQLSDTWGVTAIGASDYDLSVYGPNGFLRAFKGGVSGQSRANLDVQTLYNEATSGITLAISHQAAHAATVSVLNTYTGKRITEVLEPGAKDHQRSSQGRPRLRVNAQFVRRLRIAW